MRLKLSFIAVIALFVLISCGKADLNDPVGSKTPPAQITVTGVRNLSGASVIYYNKPDDKNMKYVRAVYTADDGVTHEVTASYFTDSILVNGFGAAGKYQVNLYSVSTGEAASAPVIQEVEPTTPPHLTAFEELKLFPTFAGVRVSSLNDTEAKLSFAVYKKTESGEWQEIDMYYTVAKNIGFSVRGQDTVETEFGVRIRDRWGHWSEIKTLTAKPWYEMECSKDLFREVVHLPSDERIQHTWSGSNTGFANLWDKQILLSAAKCFHTRPAGTSLPQHFTMDLGKAYTLSRIKIWGRGSSTDMGAGSNDWQHVWTGGYPLRIQLYGSTETENLAALADDINDPSWVLLGDHFLYKADGTLIPVAGNNVGTAEDKALLERGQELEFPSDAPKVRFFRFRTMQTYGGASAVMLDELSFWGSDK